MNVEEEEAMVAVFDLDSTLVDTNYQHALSCYRPLRADRADPRRREKEPRLENSAGRVARTFCLGPRSSSD